MQREIKINEIGILKETTYVVFWFFLLFVVARIEAMN